MIRFKEAPAGLEERRAEALAHFGTAVIYEMQGDYSAALEEAYKAARLDTGWEPIVLEISTRLLASKQPEKALDLISRSAERPDASAAIYSRLGAVYAQLGKADQAVAANQTALKKSPAFLAAYANLFALHLRAKHNAEALAIIGQAARQPKGEPEFFCGVADLYLSYAQQFPAEKTNCQARALVALDRAAALKPTSPALLLLLADTYMSLNRENRAAEFYLDLLKHLPESSPGHEAEDFRERIHAKLTAIYLRASDRGRAVEQLEAILAGDPANASVHYCLGALAFEDKKYDAAAARFRETIILNPAFEKAYYDLATVQLDQNKPSEALATLDSVRARFGGGEPSSFTTEFMTGLALSMQKSWTEALRHFSSAEIIAKATEPGRLNQFFYFEVGAALERKGDLAEAEKLFLKCLDLSPGFAQALNYLGYMWAEKGLHLDRAREMIAKALAAEPDNGAYLDSMGWVLFKLNQPREALGYILKACQGLDKPDGTVFDHLGDIYQALKQPEKAREAWAKSLAAEPSDEVRKKLDAAGAPAARAK